MTDIAAALAEVRERIAEACGRCGRSPQEVRILAVTKTHPAAVVRQAIAAGVDAVAENRVQEALTKRPEVPETIPWHLVGPLQRNKARRALELFDVIQSMDRLAVADRLEALASPLDLHVPVFVDVNVGEEPQKSGVTVDQAAGLVEAVLTTCPHLSLQGLMTIPPYHPDPQHSRPYYVRLRKLGDELSARFGLPVMELSMGMSEDFEVAVEEGATWVRLGRVLLGARRQ